MRVCVVGGGIFGITAAIALQKRGCHVNLVDPGPIPHPLAESTDISKVVRLDYGADADYLELMESAREGWLEYNHRFGTLYHETGVLFIARTPMAEGGFERESMRMLATRGHAVERLDEAAIASRYPAYNRGDVRYVDGYFNPIGGWAESGRAVSCLAQLARDEGVHFTIARIARLDEVDADCIVVAAGSWTQTLIPVAGLRAVGQPVFHLQPGNASDFRAEVFPVFGADIAQTGWYGFPVCDGVVKIANHGVGRAIDPLAARPEVSAEEIARLREFLAGTFPSLANAPIVKTRLCVYGDSADEHFIIDRHPERPNVVIAAGGSGHGFKFAPVMGDLIADAALGVSNRALEKFKWRSQPREEREAARHR